MFFDFSQNNMGDKKNFVANTATDMVYCFHKIEDSQGGVFMKKWIVWMLICVLIGGYASMMVGAEETPAVYYLLSDCETTDGWATEKSRGSLSLSTDAAVGQGSVQIKCKQEMFFFFASQSGQLDFTNVTHFDFWFYTSDPKIFTYGDCGFDLSYSEAWSNAGVSVKAAALKKLTLQTGWNHLTVPLDFSGYNEFFDIEHIGRFRFYAVGLPADMEMTVAVDDVKAVNMQGLEQADQLMAQSVIDKIHAIGNVNTYSRIAITDARKSYDGLSDVQKALVTNLNLLTAAEKEFAKLGAPISSDTTVLSNCDSQTGWDGRHTVNTTLKTEGTGSIENTFDREMMYYYNNTAGVDFTGVTHVEFDFYTTDTAFFSHGDCGMNFSSVGTGAWWSEQGISVQAASLKGITLKSGWNHIKVPLNYIENPAAGFDVKKVTNIRYYAVGFNTSTTVLIDDFKLVKEVAGESLVTIPDAMRNKPELSKEQDAWMISACDSESTVSVSSAENVNVVSADNQKFTAFTGLSAGVVEIKVPAVTTTPIAVSGVNKNDLALRLQLYVDHAASVKTNGQVELTSGGKPDANELHWNVQQLGLKDGWNVVYLDFSDGADTNGTLDISKINYFRFYMFLNTDAVMAIDEIKIVKRQVVAVKEDFSQGDSLLKWNGINAQLTRENESLVIKGNGDVTVSSSAYSLPIVHSDRTPLEFTLFTENPKAVAELSVVLTDGRGRTATMELDASRMNGLTPTGYQVVPSKMTADKGFNPETVATVTLKATLNNTTLVMDNFEVNVRNGQYWRDWVYNYTPTVGDYSIAVIPDIQELTAIHPQKLNTVMDWLVANKEKENLQFAIDVGDITWNGHAKNETEFQTAAAAFKKLQDAGIDYSISYGNHDYTPGATRDTALLNQYFPLSNMSTFDSYGGAMTDGKIDNMYYCFAVQGNQYMVLSLEFDPLPATVAWANQVVSQHPDHQVIVVTHNYMNNVYGQYSYTGHSLWRDLVSKHKNIIMTICGHECVSADPGSLSYRKDRGENGNTVHQVMVNSQDIDAARGGVGLLLMLRFTNGGKTIDFNYFSPVNGNLAYKPQNQFTLYLDNDEQPDAKTYTLTFNTNGGSTVAPQVLQAGDTPKAVADPTKKGTQTVYWQFNGWYYNDKKIDLATFVMPGSDVELVAEWTKVFVDPPADIIYGDVDGDGKVTAADALEVLKSVVGKVTLTDIQMTVADTDGNGKADAADALNILKKVVGKIDSFPVENK